LQNLQKKVKKFTYLLKKLL